VVVVPTGGALSKLVTRELTKGSGVEAKAGERVTVSYVYVLYKSGKVFDASWKRKEPFSSPWARPGDPGRDGIRVAMVKRQDDMRKRWCRLVRGERAVGGRDGSGVWTTSDGWGSCDRSRPCGEG
jgi:hypothetical protein